MEDGMEEKDLTRSCGSVPRDRRTQRHTKKHKGRNGKKFAADTRRDGYNVNRINVFGFDKRCETGFSGRERLFIPVQSVPGFQGIFG
jgi:hypothetical protein